jgi:hypothetical protein
MELFFGGLEALKERHDALTKSLEIVSHDIQDLKLRRNRTAKTSTRWPGEAGLIGPGVKRGCAAAQILVF